MGGGGGGLASFNQHCPVHLFAIVACVDIIQMQLAHLCFNVLQVITLSFWDINRKSHSFYFTYPA